jgi:hypothetical protein
MRGGGEPRGGKVYIKVDRILARYARHDANLDSGQIEKLDEDFVSRKNVFLLIVAGYLAGYWKSWTDIQGQRDAERSRLRWEAHLRIKRESTIEIFSPAACIITFRAQTISRLV